MMHCRVCHSLSVSLLMYYIDVFLVYGSSFFCMVSRFYVIVSCYIDNNFVCIFVSYLFFFFKQKTAYEMRISDWSSDVCSSDLSFRTDIVATSRGSSAVKSRGTPSTRISGCCPLMVLRPRM